MKIKLVVFDWNGTLFADHQAVLTAANASEVPGFGLPPITLAQMRDYYEVPLWKAYQKMGVDPETYKKLSPDLSDLFHKIYEPLAAQSKTRPGTKQTLQQLDAHGIRSVILSNHTVEGIYSQLSRLHLLPYFSDVLANEDTTAAHHTGKQHRLEAYLHVNHFAPEEVLIIGDTPEETRIGRALGLTTVSISGGMCSRSRLVAENPDHLITSVPQLLPICGAS